MSNPKRILIIEIRTIDNPDLDSSQLSTITAHTTDTGRLYLDSIDDAIRSAIVDGIVHLGSNYRHPLLFDVQVLSGDDIDIEKPLGRRRRRRRRRSSNS